MSLDLDRRYAAVPQYPLYNGRPVFATTCGDTGQYFIGIPQAPPAGTLTRALFANAGCFDGQNLDDWRVVGIPQYPLYNGRPVFAFSCCPATGGSGSASAVSGSLSSSVSGSVSASASASGSASVSGSVAASGISSSASGIIASGSGSSGSGTGVPIIFDQCCLSVGIPGILYVTFDGPLGGLTGDCTSWPVPLTLELVYSAVGTQPGWTTDYTTPDGYTSSVLFYCYTPDQQDYILIVNPYGGNQSQTVTACSPFSWSNPPTLGSTWAFSPNCWYTGEVTVYA